MIGVKPHTTFLLQLRSAHYPVQKARHVFSTNAFTPILSMNSNTFLRTGEWSLANAGLPQDLLSAINDWHTLTRDAGQYEDTDQSHNIGVTPGDGIADMLVCMCLCTISRHPCQRIKGKPMLMKLPYGGRQVPLGPHNLQAHSNQSNTIDFLPPT